VISLSLSLSLSFSLCLTESIRGNACFDLSASSADVSARAERRNSSLDKLHDPLDASERESKVDFAVTPAADRSEYPRVRRSLFHDNSRSQ